MYQITAHIDGMACGMCEAHIADTIRKAFPEVKSVKANRKKKVAIVISPREITSEEMKNAIDPTGYVYDGLECEPYIKKKLFGF